MWHDLLPPSWKHEKSYSSNMMITRMIRTYWARCNVSRSSAPVISPRKCCTSLSSASSCNWQMKDTNHQVRLIAIIQVKRTPLPLIENRYLWWLMKASSQLPKRKNLRYVRIFNLVILSPLYSWHLPILLRRNWGVMVVSKICTSVWPDSL